MQKIRLGATGLDVSPLSLGTMHYGLDYMGYALAAKQMEAYISAGGNLIDTAQVYNNWVPGECSRSEKVIGQFLHASGMRDQVYLCTKGGHPVLDGTMTPRLHPSQLAEDLHKSLENLQTDYIDLYLLHRDDPSMPVDEILGMLEAYKSKGLIRHYGCSNWTLPRVIAAKEAARRSGASGFAVNQIWWSLATINTEKIEDQTLVPMGEDFLAFHKETAMAVMAYSSQAKGYFSKRYAGATMPKGTKRLYDNSANDLLMEKITHLCHQFDTCPTAIALAWLVNQPFPTIPVVTCNNDAQLNEAMLLFNQGLVEALKGLL